MIAGACWEDLGGGNFCGSALRENHFSNKITMKKTGNRILNF